jgi:hypothetical protein
LYEEQNHCKSGIFNVLGTLKARGNLMDGQHVKADGIMGIISGIFRLSREHVWTEAIFIRGRDAVVSRQKVTETYDS